MNTIEIITVVSVFAALVIVELMTRMGRKKEGLRDQNVDNGALDPIVILGAIMLLVGLAAGGFTIWGVWIDGSMSVIGANLFGGLGLGLIIGGVFAIRA